MIGVSTPSNSAALVYAYCSKNSREGLVIAAANPSKDAVTLQFEDKQYNHLSRSEYVFTSANGDLTSIKPLLNGVTELELQASGDLPTTFAPLAVPAGSGKPIVLPGYSSGYFELHGASVIACKGGKTTR